MMQQSQLTNLNQSDLQERDRALTESLIEPELLAERDMQPISPMGRVEIWIGRVAMFGLTTTIAAIAVHAR